jgi:hypothetical protein
MPGHPWFMLARPKISTFLIHKSSNHSKTLKNIFFKTKNNPKTSSCQQTSIKAPLTIAATQSYISREKENHKKNTKTKRASSLLVSFLYCLSPKKREEKTASVRLSLICYDNKLNFATSLSRNLTLKLTAKGPD